MEDYNKILSRSEEEKQCILKIVSEYRKKFMRSRVKKSSDQCRF